MPFRKSGVSLLVCRSVISDCDREVWRRWNQFSPSLRTTVGGRCGCWNKFCDKRITGWGWCSQTVVHVEITGEWVWHKQTISDYFAVSDIFLNSGSVWVEAGVRYHNICICLGQQIFFSRPTPIGGPWASHWLTKGGREGGTTLSSTNRKQEWYETFIWSWLTLSSCTQ